jgi:hypothetical protein
MKVEKSSQRRQMPGVDFEELNFEQRRVPYNTQRTPEAVNNREISNGDNTPRANY